MSNLALDLRAISKRFGQVHANSDINLQVKPATIHGIIGENGAGKSTLVSIIYGFYQADSGEIYVDEKLVNIKNSQTAINLGIGMVHQHFMLVENLSVLDNIILGAEDGAWLPMAKKKARAKLEALQVKFGLEVDLDQRIDQLPVGLQQRVEIAKALYRDAKILILDEPTGVLTPQEADALFVVLNGLRVQGVTVLLITHKLREILAITDQVSVMRGGKMVAHRQTKQTNTAELAELMVGRPVLLEVDKTAAKPNHCMLDVEDLTLRDARGVERLKSINFKLHAGEILGVAGVSGNGQSELLEVLAGLITATEGHITLQEPGEIKTRFPAQHYPDAASLRKLKLAHVPEDRIKQGLVRTFSAAESAILGYQDEAQFGSSINLDPKAVIDQAAQLMRANDVRPQDPNIRSANLSGGNQQKLILAREMSRQPAILLVGQPTRGVDIGAIEMIYKELIKARDEGAAILMVSVELDEILALSDRIAVMCAGDLVGIVDGASADAKTLGLMMAGAQL